MRDLIVYLLYVYAIVIVVQSLLSWVAYRPGTPIGQIQRALARVTDPVLNPIRRALPRTTMLDFSPMVAIGACYVLAAIIGR